ncbi:hypothetical protein PATSB16_20740 [Pandoraea thiooxydans]|nr:hypothetical protein PATSB16_20740 [Pandoraea thiooxydans]
MSSPAPRDAFNPGNVCWTIEKSHDINATHFYFDLQYALI